MSVFNYDVSNSSEIFKIFILCYLYIFQTNVLNNKNIFEIMPKMTMLGGESFRAKMRKNLSTDVYHLKTNRDFELFGYGNNSGSHTNETETITSWKVDFSK